LGYCAPFGGSFTVEPSIDRQDATALLYPGARSEPRLAAGAPKHRHHVGRGKVPGGHPPIETYFQFRALHVQHCHCCTNDTTTETRRHTQSLTKNCTSTRRRSLTIHHLRVATCVHGTGASGLGTCSPKGGQASRVGHGCGLPRARLCVGQRQDATNWPNRSRRRRRVGRTRRGLRPPGLVCVAWRSSSGSTD
jgi:hypothetical protein